MKRKRRTCAILLVILAVLVTQLPVTPVNAVSDTDTTKKNVIEIPEFEVVNGILLKYNGNDIREEVKIPKRVSVIGMDAFKGCDKIKKVNIPNTVKKIEHAAFADCTSLEEIAIPDSVTDIGSSAFLDCTALKRVTIGAGTVNIAPGSFGGCTELTTIALDGSNPKYTCEDGVLYNKDKTEIIQYLSGRPSTGYTMPDSVKKIGQYAFWGSPLLTSVGLSENIKEIGKYAFSNCNGLANMQIPDTVSSIDTYAFENCRALQSVNIPKTVDYIHATAFKGCPKLQLMVESGSYGEYFANTQGIKFNTGAKNAAGEKNTNDAANTTGADDTAGAADAAGADDTAGVADTTGADDTAGAADTTGADDTVGAADIEEPGNDEGSTYPQAVFGYPNEGSQNAGKNLGAGKISHGAATIYLSGGTVYDNQIIIDDEMQNDQTIKTIEPKDNTRREVFEVAGDVLGSYNGDGGEVSVSSDIAKIGNRAFYRNSELESILFPENLKEIGDFAFARSGLQSIDIPEGVTSIGYAAFYKNKQLNDVTIPKTVTNIDLGAFDGSEWLNNWKNKETISDYLIVGDGILLKYKGNYEEITIPKDVKVIGPEAFLGNEKLKKLMVPGHVKRIEEGAFSDCSGLKKVSFAEGLEAIEDRAFQNAPLTQIIIPESVKTIGVGAFDASEVTDTDKAKAVIFKGTDLPELSYEKTATRLPNQSMRTLALKGIGTALVPMGTDLGSGTILDGSYEGFRGKVYELPKDIKEYENQVLDVKKLTSTANVNSMTGSKGEPSEEGTGIQVIMNKSDIRTDVPSSAVIENSTSPYKVIISNSEEAEQAIENGLKARYGKIDAEMVSAMDISMYDESGTLPFTRVGKNPVKICIPIPDSLADDTSNLEVACVDDNGILELVPSQLLTEEGIPLIQFEAAHFSPYAVFRSKEAVSVLNKENQTALSKENEGTEIKTGVVTRNWGVVKNLPHPKWALVLILLVTAGYLFFKKDKKRNR